MVEALVKYFVIAVLGLVLVSLAVAFRQLTRGGADAEAAVKALTVRVTLSVALVLFLVFAGWMGWVRPHGLPPTPPIPQDATQSQ